MDSSFSIELHFRNEIEALKKRLRDQESLFEEQDEEAQKEINKLKSLNKALSEEIKTMEVKLVGAQDEMKSQKLNTSVEIKRAPVVILSEAQPYDAITDSFLNNYESVQDRCDVLEEEKKMLEEKLSQMILRLEEIEDANGKNEALCSDYGSIIEELKKENSGLKTHVKELQESIFVLQAQAIAPPIVTEPADRGNSMFAEVNEARLTAEAELRKLVDQNVALQKELDDALTRNSLLTRTAVTHADQGEIDFQKNFGQKLYDQLQEQIKMKEEYMKENEELHKKLAAFDSSTSDQATSFQLATIQHQLEKRNKEYAKLQKTCEDQTKQIYDLGGQVKELSSLKNEIKSLEYKKGLLEDEVKLLKGNRSNPGTPRISQSKENQPPKKPVLLPSTPRTVTAPPRLNPSKTQPDPIQATSKWQEKLKTQYKKTALESCNRERASEAFPRPSRIPSAKANETKKSLPEK